MRRQTAQPVRAEEVRVSDGAEPGRTSRRSSTSGTTTALLVVAGVLLLFAALVIVLWRTGVFDKNTSRSDAQIVAAMLTLLGGVIASAFTLVGVLLKHSIDL